LKRKLFIGKKGGIRIYLKLKGVLPLRFGGNQEIPKTEGELPLWFGCGLGRNPRTAVRKKPF